MVSFDGDKRQERDQNLIYGFADRSRQLLRDYELWIGDETEDLHVKVQTLESITEGELKSEFQAHIQQLEDIMQNRLPEAKRNLRAKCAEIEDGACSDIIDAHQWIQDGLSRFENMSRSLLYIRELVDKHWKSED